MLSTPSRRYRILTITAVVAVLTLSMVGAIVRTTGSGLGCPDWPLCYGRMVPPPQITAWIEFSHRAVAGITGLLMVAVLIGAWNQHRDRRDIVVPVTVAMGLLAVQVPLGAIVVGTHLEPLIVGFHLTMAMLITAGLMMTALAANRPDPNPRRVDPGTFWLVGGALAATLALLLTGATVVGTGAQVACPDWPLCYGTIIPMQAGANPLITYQLIHRFTVAAVSVLAVLVIVRAFRRLSDVPGVVTASVWLGALFAMQIMVGAMQVLFVLPTVYRVLHVGFATAIWAALVAILTMLWRANRGMQTQRIDGRVPAPAGD